MELAIIVSITNVFHFITQCEAPSKLVVLGFNQSYIAIITFIVSTVCSSDSPY